MGCLQMQISVPSYWIANSGFLLLGLWTNSIFSKQILNKYYKSSEVSLLVVEILQKIF